MLPLPDLDDRRFKDIVEDARRLIPRIIPEWTDMNYHDPGITMIDLLAWLVEMQQYHLNRITVANELKFLQLLGLQPREAGPARALVSFDQAAGGIFLPAGTQLGAEDRVFETEEPLYIQPVRLEKILSFSDTGSTDCTPFNHSRSLSYLAFGSQPRRHSRLYLGFDQPLIPEQPVSMSVHLFAGYPVATGEGGEEAEILTTARIAWSYYGSSCSEDEAWQPLEIIEDQTRHFYKNGRIIFQVPGLMKAGKIGLDGDRPRYLLCAELVAEGYEIAPRIQEITLNTVPAVQRQTLAEFSSFSSSGQPGQRFIARSYLALYGDIRVQVQDQEGCWYPYEECEDLSGFGGDDPVYVMERDHISGQLSIYFGDGKTGRLPPAGENNIRLLAAMPDLYNEGWLGSSNGLPGQRLRLPYSPVVAESFKIQISKRLPGSSQIVWEEWQRVENFDASGPTDRHFIIEQDNGKIVFGNNEKGLIPEPGEEFNIRLLAGQLGGGERGNVKEDEINRIIRPGVEWQSLELSNHFPAWGGSEPETLDESKLRLYRDMKKSYRAVSSEDFAKIALNTPGLRVARAQAIPLFAIDKSGHPVNSAEAQVSVVVVPFSNVKKPQPSTGFLETVRRHLDKHRLLCTEIHVIGPEYIKVNVYGVIVVKPGFKLSASRIEGSLEKFLQPVDSTEPSQGWVFGRTVYKGDIYEVINRIEGVEYIKELWLNAEGAGVRKDLSGDIQIPPHGLAYLGECEMEIIQLSDL